MQTEEPEENSEFEKRKKDVNAYVQYSAMGFQMFAVIAVFAFIGYKIDESKQMQTPLYTAFFSLAGVLASLYLIIRSIKKLNS
jgi:Mn2+/Fe2+ NRAMP family transporter